jgi:excinuclease UvrABC ATPase subunit
MLLAPVVRRQKGEFRDVIERLAREGFVRARVDGEFVELAADTRVKLDKKKFHNIEAVVDRLVIDEQNPRAAGRFGRDRAALGRRRDVHAASIAGGSPKSVRPRPKSQKNPAA